MHPAWLEEHHVLLPDTALLYQSVELRDYDAFLCEALQNEPSLNYLRKQTEIAQVDVKVARAASLPGVSLYASNTLARPVSRTMADFYNNNWNIGLSVSYSLSSLYKNNHKIRENKLAVLLSKNEEDCKLQQIRVEVRQAYLRHHEALKSRSAETVGTAGGRELPHHAEPLLEPAGHSDRPAGCEQCTSGCGTPAYFGTYAGDLYVLSVAACVRTLVAGECGEEKQFFIYLK